MKRLLAIQIFLSVSCTVLQAQSVQNFAIPDGTALQRMAPYSVSAEPCKQAQQSFRVPIDVKALDSKYVSGLWPAGIEIQTLNALGITKISSVSLAADALTFTLEAEADGTWVSPPSGTSTGQVCVGGRSAYVDIAVIAHYTASAPTKTSDYKSPKPDVRLAFDFGLLKRAAAGFQYYKLGEWIRLGEAPWFCGDRTMFDVLVKDQPSFAAIGYLNPDGAYGTSLGLSATARAQIHGCLGDPLVEAAAHVSASAGPFGGGSLPANGSVNLTFAGIFSRSFPFGFNIPIPSFSSLPIDLPASEGVGFEFGTFDGTTFTPSATPGHKDIPIAVNVGSFGGSSNDNNTFIVDATVGSAQAASLTSASDAQAYFTSDRPIWNQQNIGVTVRDSFFGSAETGKSATGMLGSLLPIRASGNTTGVFRKHFEIVFDGASAEFVKHDGADAIAITLSSSYAKIGSGGPIIGHGKPIKKITARVLLDRITADGGVLKFRVADFRIKISTWFLFIPIKLSSGQLEKSLNNGQIPLTGNINFEIDLPICVYTGFNKFMSPPNTCNPQPWFEHLGYFGGPQKAVFTIDPATLATRFNKFEVGGQKWQGLQASAQVRLTQ